MKSKGPKFSVIITTFNRAILILETLDSVFEQSYKNYEIIIVDDASTDDTVEILQPLVRSGKVKLIVNEQNSERCFSRNVGFEEANGDFLTLLDSDDFMYSTCLEDAACYIKENPKSQFFHNYYELVDNNKNVIYNYSFPDKKDFTRKLAEGNFISCIGNFLSKEIYSHYRFSLDPKVLGSEDWEIWLRVYSSYDLGVIPKVNHGVRHHDTRSVNSLDYGKMIDTKLHIVDNLFNNKEFSERFNPYKKFMIASIYLFAAVGANKNHDFYKSKKNIFKAIKKYPEIIFTNRFIRVTINALLKIKKEY